MRIKGINMFMVGIWLWGAAFFLLVTSASSIGLGIVLFLILIERVLAQIALRTIFQMLVEAVASMKNKNANE